VKNTASLLGETVPRPAEAYTYAVKEPLRVADPVVQPVEEQGLEQQIEMAKRQMTEAARRLDFMEAARYRDKMIKLQDMLKRKPAGKKPKTDRKDYGK
jgi:excinuclease ABC subunit B